VFGRCLEVVAFEKKGRLLSTSVFSGDVIFCGADGGAQALLAAGGQKMQISEWGGAASSASFATGSAFVAFDTVPV
jgi:hypothetical protein